MELKAGLIWLTYIGIILSLRAQCQEVTYTKSFSVRRISYSANLSKPPESDNLFHHGGLISPSDNHNSARTENIIEHSSKSSLLKANDTILPNYIEHFNVKNHSNSAVTEINILDSDKSQGNDLTNGRSHIIFHKGAEKGHLSKVISNGQTEQEEEIMVSNQENGTFNLGNHNHRRLMVKKRVKVNPDDFHASHRARKIDGGNIQKTDWENNLELLESDEIDDKDGLTELDKRHNLINASSDDTSYDEKILKVEDQPESTIKQAKIQNGSNITIIYAQTISPDENKERATDNDIFVTTENSHVSAPDESETKLAGFFNREPPGGQLNASRMDASDDALIHGDELLPALNKDKEAPSQTIGHVEFNRLNFTQEQTQDKDKTESLQGSILNQSTMAYRDNASFEQKEVAFSTEIGDTLIEDDSTELKLPDDVVEFNSTNDEIRKEPELYQTWIHELLLDAEQSREVALNENITVMADQDPKADMAASNSKTPQSHEMSAAMPEENQVSTGGAQFFGKGDAKGKHKDDWLNDIDSEKYLNFSLKMLNTASFQENQTHINDGIMITSTEMNTNIIINDKIKQNISETDVKVEKNLSLNSNSSAKETRTIVKESVVNDAERELRKHNNSADRNDSTKEDFLEIFHEVSFDIENKFANKETNQSRKGDERNEIILQGNFEEDSPEFEVDIFEPYNGENQNEPLVIEKIEGTIPRITSEETDKKNRLPRFHMVEIYSIAGGVLLVLVICVFVAAHIIKTNQALGTKESSQIGVCFIQISDNCEASSSISTDWQDTLSDHSDDLSNMDDSFLDTIDLNRNLQG